MAKILIVEDEKVLNQAYQLVLEKEGYKITAVYNGEEAKHAVEKQKFDLILLDLRMPKMDGIEFLKAVAPKQNMPDTRIIIFSNYDEQKEVDEAIQHGATRYILKAWSSPKELVKLVRDTLDE